MLNNTTLTVYEKLVLYPFMIHDQFKCMC